MSASRHLISPRRPARATTSRHRLTLARPGSIDERTTASCLFVITVYLADRAIIHNGSAGALGGALLLLGIGAIAVTWALFKTGGRRMRATLTGAVGIAATAIGLAISVPHALIAGPSGGDYSGLLLTAAGLILMALAFRTALHGRRLAVKLTLGVLCAFVIAQWLIAPAINAGLVTNAPRHAKASATTLGLFGARDVTFAAGDGTRLSGWYVPGRTAASVVLLHGAHDTRGDTLLRLRMLHTAGYAVLAYDARGHGDSAGQTNALGWAGANDLAGALAFLDRQPGIDPRRVAALGLSMGAEAALRAAATGVPLRAVIADGAGASTLGDNQLVRHGLAPVFTSETWLTMRGIEVISGETEPPPLKSVVGRIHIPVLLIASNAPHEQEIDTSYRQRIGPTASLWYVRDAGHTNAFDEHPQAYAKQVLGFLEGTVR